MIKEVILLREIERSDLIYINQWRHDKDTISNLGTPFRYINREVDDKWFDSYMSTRANNIRLAICDSSDNKIIGCVYLLSIDWVNRNAELAIWIGNTSNRGRGIGKKALDLTLNHAFFDLNLHRLYLTVLETNENAMKLYLKSGFKNEGILYDSIFKHGKFQNQIVMGIISTDYKVNLQGDN